MTQENMHGAEDSPSTELDLFDYWLLVRAHYRQIVLLATLITLMTTLVVFQMTPVYRSTALLLIENSKAKVLKLSDLYDEQRDTMEAFNSQIQIIKSRPVAENVIGKLKLLEHAAMNPRKEKSWFDFGWFTPIPVSKEEQATREFNAVLDRFEGNLTIEPILKSQVVKISFDSTDKELAAKIANAVVEAYIDLDLEARAQMTQKANVWLTQRMEELRQKLEQSEHALQQYREQENIVDNKGVVLSGSGKQFEEVTTNLVSAKMRLAEAQSAYDHVRELKGQPLEMLESIPAVLKDSTVQQMKQHQSEANKLVTEYSSRYAPAHPKMIAALNDQNAAHEALAKAVDAVINGITREYEIARANANAAAGAVAQSKAEIQSISRKESQLNALQHEVDSNKQILDTFVNRAKETEVSSNMQSVAGRLIDPAEVVNSPLKPKKLQVISIAAILGLLAGVAFVFFLDYLDSTMHSIPDVERRLHIDVLGTVQILEASDDKSAPPAREFMENPNSNFSESIRSIRTAVLLSSIDNPHKVVVVTSTVPSEGKTTVAINLAFALGQLKKVLIIDCDIRKPSVGKAIGEGMDQGKGLVDFLAGDSPMKDCIRSTNNPNVFVLPAGSRFNSPLELLSSHRFGETITKLKETFDVLVIDSPPLKPVSDSLIISRYANAMLYVVKADATPHPIALTAIKRLQAVNAPLLGVILNQVDFRKADRYGYYGYRYQYHYQYQYQHQYTYGQEPPPKKRASFLGIKI